MLFLNKLIRHALFYFVSIALIPSGMASQSSSQDNAPIQTTRLVTDADHKNFLIETLNAAKKSVMISSYDVSPTIFQNDNIAGSIINAANRGVKVYIYFEHPTKRTVQEIHKLKALESYCAKFEVNCNHSKCVLKDNDTVAIGSYNWLSHFNDTGSNATIVTTDALASHL
jgi:phosphatidylserine/phosphatidylglycerophosphate/cardiolipin synthase-like enzyme